MQKKWYKLKEKIGIYLRKWDELHLATLQIKGVSGGKAVKMR